MEPINIYVFRLAKGHGGGIIKSNSCPIEIENQKENILQELEKIEDDIIQYENSNYLEYLHNELWECHKLRQGWGLENLDLRDGEVNWVKNYILGAKKYWGVEIKNEENYCHIAMGRFNILKNMLEMKKGDLIFIPKHSCDKIHDENYFTVAKVAGSYYFDLNKEYKDFGHIIPVTNLKSYQYNKSTLLGKDFGTPYRKAISKIKPHHQLYKTERFKKFIGENYDLKI